MQSPPCSFRRYECHGVVSHPPFWVKNPSPVTVALSQQNALLLRVNGRYPPLTRQNKGKSTENNETTPPVVLTKNHLGGVFAQRVHSARTAPVITVFTPVTALKTCHL